MVEKQYKPDVVKVLAEVADKFGMELKRKDTDEKIELPDIDKDYLNMSARELTVELNELDDKIKVLDEQTFEIRKAIVVFANKEIDKTSGPFRTLFVGNVLDERKLNIMCKEQRLKSNLKIWLTDLMNKKLEEEITGKFIAANQKFKELVSNIRVAKTPTGEQLQVILK